MKTQKLVTLPIFSSFVSRQDEAKRMCTPGEKKKEAKKIQTQKEHDEK